MYERSVLLYTGQLITHGDKIWYFSVKVGVVWVGCSDLLLRSEVKL